MSEVLSQTSTENIENWRFYFNTANSPNLVPHQYFFLYGITCEKSGRLHLAEPGLMAGWQTKFGLGLKI